VIYLLLVIEGVMMRLFHFLRVLLICFVTVLISGATLAQEVSPFKHWRLLSWSADQTVRVWSVETGEELLRLEHDAPVGRARMLDNDTILSYTDYSMHLWNAVTGEHLLSFKDEKRMWQVILLPTDQLLIQLYDPFAQVITVHIVDRRNGEILSTMGDITKLYQLGNGYFYLKPVGLPAQIWNETFTRILFSLENSLEGPVNYVVSLREGRIFAVVNSIDLYVWDATDGELLFTLSHDLLPITSLEWGSGSRVFSRADGIFTLWDLVSEKRVTEFTSTSDSGVRTFSMRDGTLGITPYAQPTQLRDGYTGTLLATIYDESHSNVERLGDDRFLTWNDNRQVNVWDGQTPNPLLTINHASAIVGARSVRGTHILSWGENGSIWLWDATTGELLRDFRHADEIMGTTILIDE
jgi:WD40 repeat protein